MPGRRNFARERAEHTRLAPHRQRQLYTMMVTYLPSRERALVGRAAILAYLHDFGLRRRTGEPLTWRIILRWRRDHGFPLVRGVWHPAAPTHPASRSPALTTTHALTAWLLTQWNTDERGFFRVVSHPTPAAREGRRPSERAA